MQGIIWLWKHRHCWEQLKYLHESRGALKLALSTSKAEDAEEIRICLRDFERVPLVRPIPERLGKIYPIGPMPRGSNRPKPIQEDSR